MEYWQVTQQILQSKERPLVVKPRLQENLLTKPPFRFLHDVILEVIRNTGFASGLYTGSELDSRSFTEKEGKMVFLEKIIEVVSLVLRQEVSARPSKIVAGLEPENTNTFLQMLGQAALLNDGAQAVQVINTILQDYLSVDGMRRNINNSVLSRQGRQQNRQRRVSGRGNSAPSTAQKTQRGTAILTDLAKPEVPATSEVIARQQHQSGVVDSYIPQQQILHSAALTACELDTDDSDDCIKNTAADSNASVLFQRAKNLLPQLTIKLQEVNNAFQISAPGNNDILHLCNHVKSMCEDSTVLAKCLESLQSSMNTLVKEGSFWSQEALKLEQQVLNEEKGLEELRSSWEKTINKLEAKFVAGKSNHSDE